MQTSEQLLMIRGLRMHFRTTVGVVKAVDGIDFDLLRNRAVVILGESGCGKTSLAKAILRLLPRNVAEYTGKVMLMGEDIMALSDEEYRQRIRWRGISLVPQASMNSLNPVMQIGKQVAEPAIKQMGCTKKEAQTRAMAMFSLVGVPDDFYFRYPFELSGGMRQRVAIAMALITSPSLIVLDEPTSALDLLTQANIFNVLKRIKRELGTSFMLITHDIATSSELANDVAIMYAGQIIELGDACSFFEKPLHPYSKMLMESVPRLRTDNDPTFIVGQPPSLIDLPFSCRFAPRCPRRMAICDEEPPEISIDNRKVRCWFYA